MNNNIFKEISSLNYYNRTGERNEKGEGNFRGLYTHHGNFHDRLY